MVGLRKGTCYRRIERPYTRHSKYKKKNYIRAIPPHKIARFQMGNEEKLKSADYIIRLISLGSLQIRSNSLESARLIINRNMESKIGSRYFLRLNVFPHHALRENKMLGGAHADRLQTGMAHSFGKVTSTAAQVKKGMAIFIAWVDKADLEIAKASLERGVPKLPGKCRIEIVENKKQ
jgi:large subunit ribosomal protein L10e